jgi:hypothetical protein
MKILEKPESGENDDQEQQELWLEQQILLKKIKDAESVLISEAVSQPFSAILTRDRNVWPIFTSSKSALQSVSHTQWRRLQQKPVRQPSPSC